jgi:hypothetical protein
MSRHTLIGRALASLDDAKIVAAQLRNALEEVGISVARAKLLEVVARLCGAHHYDELQYRFKDKTPAGDGAANAELRLLTLPEVLLLKKPESEGFLAEHLEFFDKNSPTRWCYATGSAAIKPAALEAARRLVLGEPLRPTDTKWLTGCSSEESVIEDEMADGALNVDTQDLAGARYLGNGKWSVGSNYFCRVSINEPLLIEGHGVPVASKAMAEERLCAQRFALPPDLAEGYEAFTVNIESRLMLRCLQLPDPARVLATLQFAGVGAAPHRLRAALLRVEQGGAIRLVRLAGRKDQLLAGLNWQGTHLSGERETHGSSRAGFDYSGEAGLARIWEEIRVWAACDESAAKQHSEEKGSMSAIRRAELSKWLSK